MKSSERICTYELPFGLWLLLLTDEERLVRTWLQDSKPNAEEIHSGVIKDFLDKYSSGLWEPSFVLNLVDWNMFTEKRAEVYRTLTTEVPMGSTITYGRLGNICNCSPRAVGSYMRTNKFPIIIPCHRVVGQKSLGGYSPEVQWKRVILEWELNNAKSNSGNRTFWSW